MYIEKIRIHSALTIVGDDEAFDKCILFELGRDWHNH